tara:strand:- start:118 stop:1212 length:1095 start_codon:yes stop_codon:yes gene_type:complete
MNKFNQYLTRKPSEGGCASGNSAKVQELLVELGYTVITILMQRRFEDTNRYSLSKKDMQEIIYNSKISTGKIAKEIVDEASYIFNTCFELLQTLPELKIKHAGKEFASLFNINDMKLGHVRAMLLTIIFQIAKHENKKFCKPPDRQKLFVIKDRVKWWTKFSEQIKKLTPTTKADGTLDKVAYWEEIRNAVKKVSKKANDCKPHDTFNFWADSLQAHQFRSGASKFPGSDETFWRLGLYEMIQLFFLPITKDELEEWGILVRSKDRGKNDMSNKDLVKILEMQKYKCFFSGKELTLDNKSQWHLGHDEEPWAVGGPLTITNSYAVVPDFNSSNAKTFTELWETKYNEKGVTLLEARQRCVEKEK